MLVILTIIVACGWRWLVGFGLVPLPEFPFNVVIGVGMPWILACVVGRLSVETRTALALVVLMFIALGINSIVMTITGLHMAEAGTEFPSAFEVVGFVIIQCVADFIAGMITLLLIFLLRTLGNRVQFSGVSRKQGMNAWNGKHNRDGF